MAALAVVGCHQDADRPRYRTVASGDYVDVVQSNELVGDVCPAAAAEVDRQIEELAATFGVSIAEDYKLLARVEESEEVVQENCELVDVRACFFPGQADRPPLMSSAFSMMFAGLAQTSVANFFCPGTPRDEAAIREALEDRSLVGVYTVYHEIVARVYDTYGREGFDALWAASAVSIRAPRHSFARSRTSSASRSSSSCSNPPPPAKTLDRGAWGWRSAA